MISSKLQVLAACVLWLAACGSDDDGQASSAAHAQRDGGPSTPRQTGDSTHSGDKPADKPAAGDAAAASGEMDVGMKGPGAGMPGRKSADGGVEPGPGMKMHGPGMMPGEPKQGAAGASGGPGGGRPGGHKGPHAAGEGAMMDAAGRRAPRAHAGMMAPPPPPADGMLPPPPPPPEPGMMPPPPPADKTMPPPPAAGSDAPAP